MSYISNKSKSLISYQNNQKYIERDNNIKGILKITKRNMHNMKFKMKLRNREIRKAKKDHECKVEELASIAELYRDDPIKHVEFYNLKYVQCLNYEQIILLQKDLAEAINYAEFGYKYCKCIDPSQRNDLFKRYKEIQSKLDKFYETNLIYKPHKNTFDKYLSNLAALKNLNVALDQRAKQLLNSTSSK